MRIGFLSVAGLVLTVLTLMGCAGGDPHLALTAEIQDSIATTERTSRAKTPGQRQTIQRVPEAEPLLMSQR
jgi:hypothetical protein